MQMNGTFSFEKEMVICVLQGSFLGPILFEMIIYDNFFCWMRLNHVIMWIMQPKGVYKNLFKNPEVHKII